MKEEVVGAIEFLLFFGGAILLLCFLGIVIYSFTERFKEIKYVKMEIRRAHDIGEYRYWRKELSTLYLCFISGLNNVFP